MFKFIPTEFEFEVTADPWIWTKDTVSVEKNTVGTWLFKVDDEVIYRGNINTSAMLHELINNTDLRNLLYED